MSVFKQSKVDLNSEISISNKDNYTKWNSSL